MSYHKWKIAQLALISRLLLLIAMSISCFILPDFHPGNDVLQFDLRLTQTRTSPSLIATTATKIPINLERKEGKNEGYCFCLQGHACDSNWKSRRPIQSNQCADSAIYQQQKDNSTRYIWLDQVYRFILPPVTKWDGARFLTLAVDPWARYPYQLHHEKISENDHMQTTEQVCDLYNTSCQILYPTDDRAKFFDSSEQSHAFLPLLPLIIRFTANCLIEIMPSTFLPLSYEGTVTLCAVLINMVAFVVAAISLHSLTIYILKEDRLSSLVRRNPSDVNSQSALIEQDQLLARTTAQIFCINPAGVFFNAVYSESIFAMLTFSGHAIFAKGQYCSSYLKIVGMDKHKHRMLLPEVDDSAYWWWAKFYWLPSTLLWMMASFTRSNGSFTSIWLLIFGIAKCVSICMRVGMGKRIAKSAIEVISILLFHGLLASLVAFPILFHDLRGYNFHCLVTQPQQSSRGDPSIPEWCAHYDRRFSLYAHVQRKHWNVGLLRYYEIKQIPNFILALPLLSLSFAAVGVWILHSWNRHMKSENAARGSIVGVRLVTHVRALLRWAFLSLDASTKVLSDRLHQSSMPLLGPKFLSHYAILAGFALVGAFVAHVQISTRLICSSCPAVYWFMTSLLVHGNVNDEIAGGVKGSGDNIVRLFPQASRVAWLLYPYLVLYNILGVVLHVNFLPWT